MYLLQSSPQLLYLKAKRRCPRSTMRPYKSSSRRLVDNLKEGRESRHRLAYVLGGKSVGKLDGPIECVRIDRKRDAQGSFIHFSGRPWPLDRGASVKSTQVNQGQLG